MKKIRDNLGDQRSQEICIDLPGEAVKCWRSADKVRVVLRKHRDIFFDVKMMKGMSYTIESTSDFYSPRDRKLLRSASFLDGEQMHIWVGRNFKGKLQLKSSQHIMGTYVPNELDSIKYDATPKTKPEPLMVVFGKKELPTSLTCSPDDQFGMTSARDLFQTEFDRKLASLSGHGTKFDYTTKQQSPEITEYVAVGQALSQEIRPQVLIQLESGQSVEGSVTQIFNVPDEKSSESGIYSTILQSAVNLSGHWFITSNNFKESAGYLSENWRHLDKIFMHVRVEKRAIGRYSVIIKGKPAVKFLAQLGGGAQALISHDRFRLGTPKSSFLDGGYRRTGRTGFGGIKRILLTMTENFRAGAKIQGIGTVIDIIGDAVKVFYEKDGSNDLSEFLARAGVSIFKAAATAAIGSMLAAGIVVGLGAIFTAGAPLVLVMFVVVAGYIWVANFIDDIDTNFNVKESVARWAK